MGNLTWLFQQIARCLVQREVPASGQHRSRCCVASRCTSEEREELSHSHHPGRFQLTQKSLLRMTQALCARTICPGEYWGTGGTWSLSRTAHDELGTIKFSSLKSFTCASTLFWATFWVSESFLGWLIPSQSFFQLTPALRPPQEVIKCCPDNSMLYGVCNCQACARPRKKMRSDRFSDGNF